MEDDDEFGDLYTDVLQPFQTSSAPPQPPVQPPTRSIDLNDRIPSEDEEILYGADKLKFDQPDPNLNLNKRDGAAEKTEKYWGVEAAPAPAADSGGRVFGSSSGLVKVGEKHFEQDPNFVDDVKGEMKDETLEENFGIEDAVEENEFLIPGLSSSGARVLGQQGGGGGGDDWDDSDSEDDLQIVLNDNTGGGMMMGMDGVGGQDEEDDEDGDNLVIVAGNVDPNLLHHPPMDELQDWGEDSSQAAEGVGERKDFLGGDAGKADGGVGGAAGAQKIGYAGHGYHPFHSQFKYVRPGAAPMPGAGPVASGGAQGQIRPPGSMLPFAAGRGRGEWRAPAIKNGAPMQKNFQSGYGAPAWGNNGAGRGFGSGLDFTLPSHKTIFEVDIDGFEEKPWKLQGIDISDFFNFGMNEESWKEYCRQLEQHRLEATMQSKIRVYESGRTEQEYDPDLPPELAAAAGHDISMENRNIGKMDMQSDLGKGSARSRMQLPTGKAIQVETGFGERLPSIDTRPPRLRDSDAIIEIVLQRSPEDESVPENDDADQPEDIPSKENQREGVEIENDMGSEDDHFDRRPPAYNGRKREASGRRPPFIGSIHDVAPTRGDRTSHFSETQVEDHLDSRGRTSSYPTKKHNSDRPMKRTAAERSPRLTDNNQNEEESNESVGHKQSRSSSPDNRSLEQNDANKDEAVVADDTLKDEKSKHAMKKQKLVPRREHSSVERGEEREDSKAGRSSENSNARSGSSRDHQNMRDSMEPEVIQAGNVRNRGREERYERERQLSIKGNEDSYSHRKWDPNQGYPRSHSHAKSDFDRKKGRETEGTWQEEDPHMGRVKMEEMKKRAHEEEMVRRERNKVRSEKTEHRSRKGMENGGWKGEPKRDVRREETLHAHRDSTSRRKREREEEQHSFRYKEEARLQREKRGPRGVEDKAWVGHSRLKEDYRNLEKDYQFKDTGREQISRRERVNKDAYIAHGNKVNNEERRHERGGYSGVQVQDKDKKHKESVKKGKETEGGGGAIHNSVATSRRNREEHNTQKSERASSKNVIEQRSNEPNPVARKSSKKHKENASSDDEQQESRKGRSKLERWTSHKDRDFNLAVKSSASLDIKEPDNKYNDNGPTTKLPDESSKPREIIQNPKPLPEEKEKETVKNDDAKPEDKHLDTVEKLKKRSERFKLPMPSEKEAIAIKKTENEPLTSGQPETRPDSEVKPERPARKRRWTSG